MQAALSVIFLYCFLCPITSCTSSGLKHRGYALVENLMFYLTTSLSQGITHACTNNILTHINLTLLAIEHPFSYFFAFFFSLSFVIIFTLFLSLTNTMSLPIRVPTNTHPSRLPPNYGTVEGGGGGGGGDASSFRSAVESFTGSYSRASMLYVAENLTVSSHHGSIHGDLLERNDTQHDDVDSTHKLLVGRTYSFPSLSRHTTVASALVDITQDVSARSTFLQSVFNAVNVLVGIGILALPLAFRCGGWLGGLFTFLFCALGTNYTAKIIARCLDASPGASTYGDMGAAAFHEGGRAFVSSIFIVELMTIGIAMVVLLGDGIQSFWPEIDLLTVRLLSFAILTPTMFLPMRQLAITSLIGIVACVALLLTVAVDGFTKHNRPGSLWEPMVKRRNNMCQSNV